MASKEFLEIIERMKEVHIKKSNDYASEAEPLANFKITAELVSHFKNPIDQVFVVLIGVKMARLSELLNNNKEPKNESIIDTFIDGPNYFALWGAAHLEASRANQNNSGYGIKLKDDYNRNEDKYTGQILVGDEPGAKDLATKNRMMAAHGYCFYTGHKAWINGNGRSVSEDDYLKLTNAGLAERLKNNG